MYSIKKTYEDFNGVERTETFYFHFNEVELMEMESSEAGGLEEKIKRIVEAQDNGEIITLMKDIILKAYGKKTEDGRGFIKNPRVKEEFEASPVFPMIFMELASDDEKAVKFFNGILPKSLSDAVAKAGGPTALPAA